MEPIAIEDMSSDIYVGPFHEKQRALGGTFYEDYGTLWTATFGDPVSEYWSVRRGAALWDTYALVKFHLTGRDTLLALDRLFTRRLARAEPGVVRYGMLLDEQGLMLDEATVVVVSPEEAYRRVIELGGVRLEQDDIREYDVVFRVMLDPEGNEFCLVSDA